MSMFFVYDAENAEYLLQPGSYAVLTVLLILLLLSVRGRKGHKSQKKQKMKTQEMVFCAAAIGLATAASLLKFVSLPFGGSVTLFSMLFVSLAGYFYGAKTGLTAGVAYGILQLLLEPHFYAPLQVVFDYPLAFGALGLSYILPEMTATVIVVSIPAVQQAAVRVRRQALGSIL